MKTVMYSHKYLKIRVCEIPYYKVRVVEAAGTASRHPVYKDRVASIARMRRYDKCDLLHAHST